MVAFEKVGARMREAGAPPGSWPQDTYFTEGKDIFVNGEAVQVFHQPAAHSDGDSLVFFRRSDVISAGDIFVPDRYPVIDVAAGGSINGVVNSLNRILDLTVPADKEEGGTMVIPGHGRLCDEADVVEYRDAMTIIRGRIEDLVNKGPDAGAGEGGKAHAGLRSSLRAVGRVRRGGLPEPGGSSEEVISNWRYSVDHALSTNNASRPPGGPLG